MRPSRNALVRVSNMLITNVCRRGLSIAGADRHQTVALRPPQISSTAGSSAIDSVRGAALHSLKQPRYLTDRMQPHQQVNVIRDDTHLEDHRLLLSCNDWEMDYKKSRPCEINHWRSVARSPHDMDQEFAVHQSYCQHRTLPANPSNATPIASGATTLPTRRRLRLVASATSAEPSLQRRANNKKRRQCAFAALTAAASAGTISNRSPTMP